MQVHPVVHGRTEVNHIKPGGLKIGKDIAEDPRRVYVNIILNLIVGLPANRRDI